MILDKQIALDKIQLTTKVIAHALLSHPEQFECTITPVGNQYLCIYLRCDKRDLGKLIGVKGRNADAIRCIITAIGAQSKLSTTVVIEE